MPRQLFAPLLLAAGLLAGTPAAWAAQAGTVVFVTGSVQLAQHKAALDAPVQEGDELTTGADGYIYVKTIDSGFLILRPNSRARVTAYHIDQANPANTRVKLELLSGVARSISGLGVKQARQNFRFNTPIAAIGVRGTDFIVYTDQQTSRVVVVSGGVVVSGFTGGCGPEGGGPCEGNASRELFAGQVGMLLQVQRGERMPQLLRNPSLTPDTNVPPRSDEPVGKAAAVNASVTLPSADISLDAQKASGGPLVGSKSNAVTPPVVTDPAQPPVTVPEQPPVVVPPPVVTPPVVVAPPVVVPPVVVPPVVLPPPVPEVAWGRWQSVAGIPDIPEATAKLSNGTYGQPVFAGAYVMARLSNTALVLPTEGQVSFALASSEAVLQKDGQDGVLASVDNARLNINFGNRTFTTGLTVSAGGATVPVNGQGEVTQKGGLVSNALSESIVNGYLGGPTAGEAGYVFKNTATPGITVMGATKWTR